MKFVRFSDGSSEKFGIVDGEKINEISNSPIGHNYNETGEIFDLDSIKILAPNPNPGKMLCLALNYESHLLGADRPTRPEPFYKNSNAIIGPGDTIILPKDSGLVVCESELVAIIGKRTSNVSEEDALEHIFGYTCGNDVSAREWQSGTRSDKQWW